MNLMRDLSAFERSPRWLNRSPPLENRVNESREGPFLTRKIWGVGRARSGDPLADFDRPPGGWESTTSLRFWVGRDPNVLSKDLLKMRVLNLVEIFEYVDFAFPLPVATEEFGNPICVDFDLAGGDRASGEDGGYRRRCLGSELDGSTSFESSGSGGVTTDVRIWRGGAAHGGKCIGSEGIAGLVQCLAGDIALRKAVHFHRILRKVGGLKVGGVERLGSVNRQVICRIQVIVRRGQAENSAVGLPSVFVSGAGVRVEERVLILDLRCHLGYTGESLSKSSPDDEPSPLMFPGSSSSLVMSSMF